MPDRAVGDPADTLRLDRRTLFRAALGTTGLLLLTACAGAPPLPRPLERFQNATVTPVPSPVAAAPTEVSALPAVASPSPVVASTPLATPLPRPAVNLSGVTLAYLGGASFVPAADAFLKRQIEDWMRETGARVTIEIVN